MYLAVSFNVGIISFHLLRSYASRILKNLGTPQSSHSDFEKISSRDDMLNMPQDSQRRPHRDAGAMHE